MKNIFYLTVLSFLLAFSILTINVLAGYFTTSVSPSIINSSMVQQLNFTITNLNSTENMTQVNITLPSDFAYNSSIPSVTTYYISTNTLSWNILVQTSSSQNLIVNVTASKTGIYNFSVSVLDSAGNISTNVTGGITVQDSTSPRYSNNITSPSSPVNYSSNNSYQFNISWSDIALLGVVFNWNGTNYTYSNVTNSSGIYKITLTNLSSGNYTYYWFATDNSSNSNQTILFYYNITKPINPVDVWINLTNNKNITVVDNSSILINVSGIGNISLYKDSIGPMASNTTCTSSCTLSYLLTVYSTSKHNFTAIATGNENYTSGSSTYFVMVVPNYTISTNIPSFYSSTNQTVFNISFSSPSGFNLSISGDWTNVTVNYTMTNISNTTFSYTTPTLTAGTFHWKIYGNYSNYTFNLTSTNSFTVGKVAPILNLTTITYWDVPNGTQTNISCYSNQVSVNLYRNGVLVSNPDVQTLASGVYVYKCNNTETSNYSSTSVSKNLTVIIYTANLAFTKADSLILVQQDSHNSTIINVKNTGELGQYINFTIQDINSSWYSINATNSSIYSGQTISFLVGFSVGDVEINDYTGNFKANSSNKTITSGFTLRVLPSNNKKVEINSSLASYKEEMLELGNEINQSRIQGLNTSLAENKLAQLRAKIEQGESYMVNGDYFNTYLVLREIDTLINNTRTELSNVQQALSESRSMNLIIYIVIGVCIVVGSVLAYLFWPTKMKTTLTPEISKEDIWFKLKRKWEELTKKRYRYKES